jgi:hypothetical protein
MPILPAGTEQAAKAAFDGISSSDNFRVVIATIYQDNQDTLHYVNSEFFLKIMVQKLLEKFDHLAKLDISEEESAALKEAKQAVTTAASKTKQQRAYACMLLVILTLRKMVLEKQLKLEIQD